jgi:putative selenium metabolism protein SsnA
MLIKNATLLVLSPPRVERNDVRIEDGLVIGCGAGLRPDEGEEIVDLSGKYLLPGMVNAHTHLYSSLARGMNAPRRWPKNFLEILGKIWWRLDEALDDEAIYYSALVGSIEAARFGTTTLVDHHSSPNAISGSLDLIKEAMNVVGLRGVLCYETTDRGGSRRRDAGLRENERFTEANRANPGFRGSIGAHASFTLNDDSLEEIGKLLRSSDCGVHIHVAEDRADVDDARKKRRSGIVNRLRKHGLLSRKSILAHGVHLSRSEVDVIRKSGTWLVHNPRSNMNNAVGYAPLDWFPRSTALGTDGFPADMFEESQLGFFNNQESSHKVPIVRFPEILQAGQRLVSSIFNRAFGYFKPGSPADFIVLDYNPPTPLKAHNLAGHFLFGMNSGIDEQAIFTKASRVAEGLWKRMEKKR